MDWIELARRAQETTGPDRELDAAVMMAMKPGSRRPEWMDTGYYWDGCPFKAPKLTSSVDAVLALIAEKLPGKPWKLMTDEGRFDAHVNFHEPDNYCATPALALLTSFALAMAAATPSKGDQ